MLRDHGREVGALTPMMSTLLALAIVSWVPSRAHAQVENLAARFAPTDENVQMAIDCAFDRTPCFPVTDYDVAAGSGAKVSIMTPFLRVDALEKDGRVFLSGTKIHGKRALRACSVNHRLRRQDVDYLLDVIREVAPSLMDSVPPPVGNAVLDGRGHRLAGG